MAICLPETCSNKVRSQLRPWVSNTEQSRLSLWRADAQTFAYNENVSRKSRVVGLLYFWFQSGQITPTADPLDLFRKPLTGTADLLKVLVQNTAT
jgi:hypothetical protein